MFHYRKSIKRYRGYPKPTICPFCDPETHRSILHETEHAYIIKNRVFYDVWELRDVVDHLLVIPKRHAKSLKELSPMERLEIMELISDYETQDYNIYARAVHSGQRSVPHHQHTHLIKTKDKQGRGSFFLKKPYIFFKF